jgi:hypothetical protein
MGIEDIRILKHSEPFSSSNIVMSDGRVVWVERPGRIALWPTGKPVAVYEGPAVSILEGKRITGLELNAVDA